MIYLCLVYPLPSTAIQPSLPPALQSVVLISARDLNRAIQWLSGELLCDGAAVTLRRLHKVVDKVVDIDANATNGERAMKYLCLVYGDELIRHSQPDNPKDSECRAYTESVAETGRMLAAEALESVDTATTVRMRGGQVSITDGPFAETKEQLAGFYLVDAQNLDEALEIAAAIPAARIGSIEVRPVRQLQV
ncbi:YciI family protein [Microbulbifer litoralis]|uniref:YciI family protein n=1 Tax=Microbulbifer litoralis TaxID=2933965 RepID=UPI0020286B0A|nr:YciI family protein [Microbulbifer sp. GX H0434]